MKAATYKLIFFLCCLGSICLLVSSCGQSACWRYQTIGNTCQKFEASRIFLDSETILGKIQLEFVRNIYGIRSYINVFCSQIPGIPSDPCKVLISVKTDESAKEFIVSRFTGGQRLMLSDSCSSYVIDALLCKKCVTIDLQFDEAKFFPANFERQWGKLLGTETFYFDLNSIELVDFFPK